MVNGIISYDITVNSYRTRLSKLLESYCRRVQCSVFEFELEEKIYALMIKRIEELYNEYLSYALSKGIIAEVKRSIRIYFICGSCAKKVLVLDEPKIHNKIDMII